MPQPNKPGPGRLVVGGALFIIGVLILIPSGLCSTLLLFGAVMELITGPQVLMNDIRDIDPIVFAVPVLAVIAMLLIRAGLAIRGRK